MLTLTVLSHLCSLPACDGDQPPVRRGASHTSVTCHTLRDTLRHTLCHILRQVRLSRARLDSEFFSQMRFFTTITWHFQNWENMKYDQDEHFCCINEFISCRVYFFTFRECYISLLFSTVEVVFKDLQYWNIYEILGYLQATLYKTIVHYISTVSGRGPSNNIYGIGASTCSSHWSLLREVTCINLFNSLHYFFWYF